MNIHGLKNQIKERRMIINQLKGHKGNAHTISKIEDKIARIREEIRKKRAQQPKSKRANRRTNKK